MATRSLRDCRLPRPRRQTGASGSALTPSSRTASGRRRSHLPGGLLLHLQALRPNLAPLLRTARSDSEGTRRHSSRRTPPPIRLRTHDEYQRLATALNETFQLLGPHLYLEDNEAEAEPAGSDQVDTRHRWICGQVQHSPDRTAGVGGWGRHHSQRIGPLHAPVVDGPIRIDVRLRRRAEGV